MTPLAKSISAALRQHDPLDPWLTESSWDENYWDREAELIAAQVAPAMSAAKIRQVVVEVLNDLLGWSADGQAGLDYQSRQLDAIAEIISGAVPKRRRRWLRPRFWKHV